MTFHATSRRSRVQGAARSNAFGHRLSPRLAVSFSAVEFARVAALAESMGVPVAAIVRRAVAAYTRRRFLDPRTNKGNLNKVSASIQRPNRTGA